MTMANNNLGSQIISELGEIGKKVGGEVAKIPKDVAGSAMESLGAVSAGGKVVAPLVSAQPSGEKSAWEKIDSETNKKIKRSFARKALQELINGGLKRKEPSIWERLMSEQDQKKKEQKFNSQA